MSLLLLLKNWAVNAGIVPPPAYISTIRTAQKIGGLTVQKRGGLTVQKL